MKKSKASDIALKVEHVSKGFRLPIEQASGIKQAFINRMRGIKGYTEQQVLKDISFEVKKGDFFGVVGRNGSGKSTLLKLISQIYTPDSGKITVNGSLVPFIELGVGFNPELTGRENVYLNGAMLGFSKEEIDEMYDDIVDFAELHDFMDQKLKNYSSGMQVRLAFSVAIKAQGDILVLDEVLAVGDEAFQRKCSNFFDQIKKDKRKTIILVTHSMDSVRQYCTNAMMIRDGEIVVCGSPEDVANEYSLENLEMQNTPNNNKDEVKDTGIKHFEVELLSPKRINQDDEVLVKYTVETTRDIKINIGMDLQNISNNAYIYSSGSELKVYKKDKVIEHMVIFRVRELNDMSLRVNSSIKDEHNNTLAFIWNKDAPTFMIYRNDYKDGKRTQFATLFDKGRWVK